MNNWTSHERRLLIDMHKDRYPTLDELVVAFPKHTKCAISTMGTHLSLRRTSAERWLAVAIKHFEKRRQETSSPTE